MAKNKKKKTKSKAGLRTKPKTGPKLSEESKPKRRKKSKSGDSVRLTRKLTRKAESKSGKTGKKEKKAVVKTHTRLYLILSAVFAVLTGLLFLWAIYEPDSLFSFYTDLSKAMMSGLAAITSVAPFAVWEWIVVGLTLWFFISLVVDIFRKKFWQWLSGAWLCAVLGMFLFTFLWGLNHFGPKISQKMDIHPATTSVAELREATEYYRDRANELSAQVPRSADGWFDPGEMTSQSDIAAESFEAMAGENEWFSGSTAGIKPLLSSWFFGKIGITGIFIDFTGESCVSKKTYVCAQPFTVCHEMSHRLCFAAEDEANFVAYLACERSRSMILRYSGYYMAFVYCYNALYKADRTAATEIWQGLSPELRNDCANSHTHREEVANETATKIVDAVNDTYLKMYSEKTGTQSYGEVTDLLVAWYQKNNR